jgi:hypothetical protein
VAESTKPPGRDELVAVWFALGLIFALLVGTAGALLGWCTGQSPAAAVLTGGYVFGGTLTLAILVIRLLRR